MTKRLDADAAAGTVTVYDGGDYKVIRYTAGADVNEVAFGGDLGLHRVTITEAGIADPDPSPTRGTSAP